MPAGKPMSPARVITDEKLLQLPKDGNKYEVVDGELVVSPGAGLRHENIVGEILTRLRLFARERGLGLALPSNLLYVLPSGNRRRRPPRVGHRPRQRGGVPPPRRRP